MKTHSGLSKKKGSALILVLMVFVVLFTLVTSGLFMANFSFISATRQANLKQAQLTAQSAANALASYLSKYPETIPSVLNKSTSGTITDMGSYTVSVATVNSSSIKITSIATYPPAATTTDPKYVATAQSQVLLEKMVTRGGNPFSSNLYVGKTLTLPNGNKIFNGSITLLNDWDGKSVDQGNPTINGKVIINGNLVLETSVNFAGEVYVAGDLDMKSGGGSAPPPQVWVKGNVVNMAPNRLVPKYLYVVNNVVDDKYDVGTAEPTETIDWLIGGLLAGSSTSSNSRIKIGANAYTNGLQTQIDSLMVELAKIGPLDTGPAIVPLLIAGQTITYNSIIADATSSKNFTINASGSSLFYGARLFMNSGTTQNPNLQNIVVNTNGKDVYIDADFSNLTYYAGKITNVGSGRVFLYVKANAINDLTMTSACQIGSIIEDGNLPKTRLFMISNSTKNFVFSGGFFNAFAYLPSTGFYANTGTINGSIAANLVLVSKDVVITGDAHYLINDPKFLNDTPFETSLAQGNDMWAISKWSS